ncbi:unnamed protein product, partial [Polarella glacialis]
VCEPWRRHWLRQRKTILGVPAGGLLPVIVLAALAVAQQVTGPSSPAWAAPRPVMPSAAHAGGPLRTRSVAQAALEGSGAEDLQKSLSILAESALTKNTPPEEVYEAIRVLEKAKDRDGDSGFEQLLTGEWRLIYTTGTKKTEEEVGRISYVPITAVQRFDMGKSLIRNGIYLGPLSLEFEGTLRWIEATRRMEFDFEDLKI